MTKLVALLLWAAAPAWARTVAPPPVGAPAAPQPEKRAPASRPSWEDRNNVANEWTTLSGAGDRKFLVRNDELERFQKDPKRPAQLYEITKLTQSYVPDAHAFWNNGALWQSHMDLKESEFRLSGQPQGKSLALTAVKGTESLPLKYEGRGGAFTMTRVRVERRPVPAEKAAEPAPKETPKTPPTASTPPPPATKPADTKAPEKKPAAAPRPPAGAEAALKALFPDNEAARIVARAILEDDERKAPGSTRTFLQAMDGMRADPNKLATARESWKGRIAAACAAPASGPLKSSQAFEQARSIGTGAAGFDAVQAIHDPLPLSEPAAAATAANSLCAAAKAPQAAKERKPEPKKSLTPADPRKSLRTQAPPPPAVATPERKKSETGGGATASQKKSSGDMKTYAAIGAAAGAILGAFAGPLGALVGAVVGALIGAAAHYVIGKLPGGSGGGARRAEETPQAP
ncbi:MAG: hypothetical protein HY553_00265 [Elusimicrobia bacterium]|nr:hypothetical protein [Elusimicrobiota bacterium]